MKNKIITIIISVLLVCSVAYNILQFSSNSALSEQVQSKQVEIKNVSDNINTLKQDLQNKESEINGLSTQLVELQHTLETLQAENERLTVEIEKIKKSLSSTEAPTVTETPTAGEVVGEDPLGDLSDEDIQSIFDQVAGSGNNNEALFTEDGRPIAQNNPDREPGGNAPDGSPTEWSK